jgi:sec-independent protein translocase protein TatC
MRWGLFQFGRLLSPQSPMWGMFTGGWKKFQNRRSHGAPEGKREEYSEDFFAETRMSFGEHIEVLRAHLLKAIYGFMLLTCLGVYLGDWLVRIIVTPIEDQLQRAYEERVARLQKKLKDENAELMAANAPVPVRLRFNKQDLARALDLPIPNEAQNFELTVQIPPLEFALESEKARMIISQPQRLKSFTVMESFIVYLKVAMFFGIVASSPWVFLQLWSFIAAGLYPHERRYVNMYLPISLLLFLVGVFLCEWLVLPAALHYLLSFNEWLNVEPELRLNDWLSFAVWTPLIFGLSFQLPLIMLFLERIGILGLDVYRSYRRIAYFSMSIVTVLLTPSPDPYSFIPLMVALWGLYELGILLCRVLPKDEEPESEEMVEVQ